MSPWKQSLTHPAAGQGGGPGRGDAMAGQGQLHNSWKGFSGSKETSTPNWRQNSSQPSLLGGFPSNKAVFVSRRNQPSLW